MAHVVESHFTTPYADLRRLLDNAERQLPTLAAASLADYLLLLDQIEATLAQLTTAADDTDPLLRTEQVRWADLQEKILLRSQQFVQLANKSGGFSALRRRSPASHAFWWPGRSQTNAAARCAVGCAGWQPPQSWHWL